MRTLKEKCVIHTQFLAKPCREDHLAESGVYFPNQVFRLPTSVCVLHHPNEFTRTLWCKAFLTVVTGLANAWTSVGSTLRCSRLWRRAVWETDINISLESAQSIFGYEALYHEYWSSVLILNVVTSLPNYTTSHSTRPHSLKPQWKSQNLQTTNYQQATMYDLQEQCVSSDGHKRFLPWETFSDGTKCPTIYRPSHCSWTKFSDGARKASHSV
jgi:hypothetical protein